MINVLDKFSNIDESNFLDVNVRSLKKLNTFESFQRAIDAMSEIKDVLVVANKLGRIREIGNVTHYISALTWMKGLAPINVFVGIPQISDIRAIDETTSILFDQYMQALFTALRSETLFQQIEISTTVSTTFRTSRIEQMISAAQQVADEQIIATIDEQKTLLQSDINNSTNLIAQEAQNRKNEIDLQTSATVQRIEKLANDSIARLQQAQALEEWGKIYDAEVSSREIVLFGMKFEDGFAVLLWKNIRSLSILIEKSVKGLYVYSRKRFKQEVVPLAILKVAYYSLRLLAKSITISIRNLHTFSSVLLSKLISKSFIRAVWYWAIALFGIIFVLSSLIIVFEPSSIHGWKPPEYLISGDNTQAKQVYIKIAVYLPLAIILGMGYSFAMKNYRIVSNMLDQYRHRRAVARTAQGIIISLKDEAYSDIRANVAASASKALFEHKATGHLSKKEAESLSPFDLLKSVR